VAAIGGTAVAVGGAGWIESAIYLRHQSLPVPTAPHTACGLTYATPARGRSTAGATYYVAVGLVALIPLAVTVTTLDTADYGPSAEPATAGIYLATTGILAWLILGGVTARFVISADEFRIDSTLRSIRIPRRSVGTFEARNADVRVTVTGSRTVYFRVDSPVGDLAQ